MNNEDMSGLDKAFDVVEDTAETISPNNKLHLKKPVEGDDVIKDYEYARGNLYSLIEKGQEAINGIMEVAEEGASARAYEVAGQLIKSVADTTDKLLDLQKKMKDIEEDSPKTTTNNVTNNALYVGSTSDLAKLLKQGMINTNTSET